MPSTSKNQRRAAAIAKHHPEQLYARNRSMLNMTGKQLHEFAATPEKGLPKRVKHADKRSGKRSPMPMAAHLSGGNRYNRLRRA